MVDGWRVKLRLRLGIIYRYEAGVIYKYKGMREAGVFPCEGIIYRYETNEEVSPCEEYKWAR